MKITINWWILLMCLCLVSCKQHVDKKSINNLVDNWHNAASNANLDTFFNCMSNDAVYIGTDPSERWSRKQFYKFCKPYFERGKAWDFKPYNRKIYTDKNGIIWFDELLHTWMGTCRGSGVIVKENGTYKIAHYHLSVTVKNSKIKQFLQIEQ